MMCMVSLTHHKACRTRKAKVMLTNAVQDHMGEQLLGL